MFKESTSNVIIDKERYQEILNTKPKFNPEFINTQLKIHGFTDQAVIAETKLDIIDSFPRDKIVIAEDIEKIKIGMWYDVKIDLLLYNKRKGIFGIT